jgi:uncharacterized membrane protein YdjX (TVP38/TMEM64 family)
MTDLEKHCNTEEDSSTINRRKIFSIISIVVFILFTVAIFWFIGRKMLTFFSEPDKFRTWVDNQGIQSRFIFVGMVAFQIIIAIIPGEPLEIGAGYAFGALEGTLLCMVGILIGSVIVFLFSRYFGVKAVEAIYPRDKIKRLKFLNNPKKLNALAFILFFIPGTPKDLLTYFMGLTPMKLTTWILITLTARIPSVVTSTIGGDALGLRDYKFAIIAFVVAVLVSVIGILVHNKISKAHEQA